MRPDPPATTLRVAAAQAESVSGDVTANVDTAADLVARVRRAHPMLRERLGDLGVRQRLRVGGQP